MIINIDVSGNPFIKWEDGTTAYLEPRGEEVRIKFEYKPLGVSKEYTITKTSGKKYQAGILIETRGMVLR